ncbi:hypothetical protein LEN26_012934 [Aphanomyces euteiches]|nr:hypothetical protein LEN26_012934 [Aphanomyces euteiches]
MAVASTEFFHARRSFYLIVRSYYQILFERDRRKRLSEWPKTHLNSEAAIEWRVNRFSEKIDHLNAWTDLRLTSLRLQIFDYIDSGWKVVLPRFHQLTTLHAKDTQGDMGDLYEIVAKSPRITEFKVFTNGRYTVDEKDVVNLIKWFRRQPVRVFEAEVSEWGNLNVDLRQTMYEVDRLRIVEDSSYDGIDFTKFTFPMQSLRLQSSHLTSEAVRSISYQLEYSRLNFLELIDYKDQNVDGAECLLRVLPRTRIKHLDFSALEMSPTNWCRLAPSFEVCGLESLLLGAEAFSSTFIESLATAIQKNHTISQLYLCTENIDPPTLEILIQSFSLPSRQLSAKRMIKLITNPSTRTNLSYMQNLKEFAALRECEFVQAELKPNSLATLNFRS